MSTHVVAYVAEKDLTFNTGRSLIAICSPKNIFPTHDVIYFYDRKEKPYPIGPSCTIRFAAALISLFFVNLISLFLEPFFYVLNKIFPIALVKSHFEESTGCEIL